MTKVDLIAQVAADAGLTKKDAEKAVDKVALVGFGTFEARERAARICRDPRTHAEISVPATTVPGFKAGKALKEALAK